MEVETQTYGATRVDIAPRQLGAGSWFEHQEAERMTDPGKGGRVCSQEAIAIRLEAIDSPGLLLCGFNTGATSAPLSPRPARLVAGLCRPYTVSKAGSTDRP